MTDPETQASDAAVQSLAAAFKQMNPDEVYAHALALGGALAAMDVQMGRLGRLISSMIVSLDLTHNSALTLMESLKKVAELDKPHTRSEMRRHLRSATAHPLPPKPELSPEEAMVPRLYDLWPDVFIPRGAKP